MANNQNNNRNQNNTQSRKEALCKSRGNAWKPAAMEFETTTSAIQAEIEEIFMDAGINEIDKVMVFPVTDTKSGAIVDFGVVGFFFCGGVGSNIRRNGSDKSVNINNRNVRNQSTDLSYLLNNVRRDGGYTVSDQMTSVLASYAMFDNNGSVVIKDGNQSGNKKGNAPDVAIIELDFWAVSDIQLCCRNEDNMRYDIIECELISGNKKGGIKDYKVTAKKYPCKNGRKGKHNNSSYNYDVAYNRAVASYSRR